MIFPSCNTIKCRKIDSIFYIVVLSNSPWKYLLIFHTLAAYTLFPFLNLNVSFRFPFYNPEKCFHFFFLMSFFPFQKKQQKTHGKKIQPDETEINGADADVKLNGTDSQINSQKYSQILGDHHTNYSSQVNSKSTSSSNHNFKTRSYNKENHYNQRGVVKNTIAAAKSSWQRSSNQRVNSIGSLRDGKKPEENEKSDDVKNDDSISAEPIKFNEGELFLRHS